MSDLFLDTEQIIHYPLIEHVHLAPDGQQVLFTVRTAYLTESASEFRNQIMLAPVDRWQVNAAADLWRSG